MTTPVPHLWRALFGAAHFVEDGQGIGQKEKAKDVFVHSHNVRAKVKVVKVKAKAKVEDIMAKKTRTPVTLVKAKVKRAAKVRKVRKVRPKMDHLKEKESQTVFKQKK